MISDILNIGSTIIDKLWADEDTKLKKKQELVELAQKGELAKIQSQMEMIKAEAKSSDKWTSRARPSFLYVMYIMILGAIPMGILHAYDPALASNLEAGITNWLSAIPKPMWALFGAGYLGYVGGRSFDKKKLLDKVNSIGN